MQSLHRTRGGDGHQGSKHYDAAKVADPQAPEFFAVVHLPRGRPAWIFLA